MTADVTFKAMGCRARVVVHGGADDDVLAAWAVERIEQLEALWSRFRPDSEVIALNEGNGQLTLISPETYALIGHAVHAWQITGGLFDPTMLVELVDQGYDRTHTELAAPSSAPAPGRNPDSSQTLRSSRCGDITFDENLSAVVVPADVSIDPGGIGKGLGADMVATELVERGAAGAMVDLGGDIRVAGDHPDDGAVWTVLVDDPAALGQELLRLGLTDGGIATSSQMLRRWSTNDGDRHHLLDPRTGAPSSSPVAVAVVAAGVAWQAEVLAKAALLAGFDDGERLIRDSQAVGVLFDFDGRPSDVGMLENAAVKEPST